MSTMRNLLTALLLVTAAAVSQAADAPKFVSASAVEPAVGRYLVTFGELASAEPPTTLASRLAAQYGARIEPYSREGFRGFMIVATPAKARLLSLDPRIASVVEQAVPGVAAPVVAAPVTAAPIAAAPVRSAAAMSRSPHRVAANGGTTTTLGTYVYDGVGNISTITGTAGAEEYNYDPFSRVTRGELGGSLWQEYDYDRHGNITDIRTVAAATRKLAVDPDTNQIDKPTPSTHVSGTYSAAGNMETVQWTTGGLDATFTYDGLNVVTGATFGSLTRRHLYTASDERIAAIDSSGNHRWTIRDANGQVLRRFTRINNTGPLRWEEDYVYRGTSMLVAYVPGPEKVLHFFPDHLGTPRLITGNGGAKISEHRYYPFGEEATPRGQDTESKKFTGHERDTAGIAAAADLDYMHARYYGPAFGRFLSVDPGFDWDKSNPQSWNLYAYVRNNPVNATDPDGRAIDVLLDAGSAAYGIAIMWKKVLNSEPVTWQDNAAVTVDIASAFVPGVTGGGPAIRTAANADDIVDAAKGAKAAFGKSKDAAEMAADLQKELGKNSVPFETPTTKGHIDLAGKSHFDKPTQTDVPTPHVQTKTKNTSPDGTKTSLSDERTRPATKQDVRTARELEKRRRRDRE